jgi:spermidine/putrescine transport system substrate-binding protein
MESNGADGAFDLDGGPAFSRGRFLAGAGVGLAGLGVAGAFGARAAGPPLAKGGTLNLWTWANYFDPANLAAYKKATGTKINIATYSSNDEAFAKLNLAGGSAFDIVIPTSDWVPLMVQKKLLLKLDKKRIPWKDVDPRLLHKSFDPRNDYSVPKDYGTIGVLYDPAVVSNIKTWQDFLTEGSKSGVSGKIQMSDAPDEVLGIALWAANKDWNTTSESDLRQAGSTMKAFAKNIKAFNGFDTDGAANGTYAMSVVTQGVARFAVAKKKSLKFVIPGPHSELWVDNYCILAKGRNHDQAYSFIDFMLQPKRQAKDCAFIGYPTALANVEQRVPKSVPARGLIFIKPADFKRLIPHVIHPSIQNLVEDQYNQIKAAAGG